MNETKLKIEQARVKTAEIIKESNEQGFRAAIHTTKSVMAELNRIEGKQRCIRVRMLDWLADKISHYGIKWSTGLRTMADNIHSPCSIKLPPQKTRR